MADRFWLTPREQVAARKPYDPPRTLSEWRSGTPRERAMAEYENQREYDRLYDEGTRVAKLLGGGNALDREINIPGEWTSMDPRELRLQYVYDQLDPAKPRAGGARAMDAAYDAAFQTFVRPRDTLLTAYSAANQDIPNNRWLAASLLARAPLSIVYPPAAAGTPGSPDDWRKDAMAAGVSPGQVMLFDFATDPETYMAVPAPVQAAGHLAPVLRRAGSVARYGRGIPTHLVDEAGQVIRQLRSSQPIRRVALPAP